MKINFYVVGILKNITYRFFLHQPTNVVIKFKKLQLKLIILYYKLTTIKR